jgi:ribosomal protein L7/L12
MSESKELLREMNSIAQGMKDRGAGVEDILEALRSRSPSILHSIKVMRDLMTISLQDAKHLVHYSRTWSDVRDSISAVHERAEMIAEDLGATHDPNESSRVAIDLESTE